MAKKPQIGFIGQGFVGKNYADYFESKGFKTVRYALEKPYVENKDLIAACDIVFIGVPTPTTPKGFDDSIVRNAVKLVGDGKIAVIKSTVLPGHTKSIQSQNRKKIVLFSPEFLSVRTAAYDVAHPFTNIVGLPITSKKYAEAARLVLSIVPKAPHSLICSSTEAEIFKYCHNGSAVTQVIFFNMMYELSRKMKADWSKIAEAIRADTLIAQRYGNPFDTKGGRGAGGNCFIKDFAALTKLYGSLAHDRAGAAVFKATEAKNVELLSTTKKDLDLLFGVYGNKAFKKRK